MPVDSLEIFAASKLRALRKSGRYRQLRYVERQSPNSIRTEDGKLVSFGCNDYLGLSQEPAVIEASVEATRTLGVGAGASRLITGNHVLYEELEHRLAELKQAGDAVVFGSGYLANIGVVSALAGSRDLICLDELSHSCLLSGAQLARSRVESFRHNDVEHLAEILLASRARHRRCLILTETVFSMDGDLAPIEELSRIALEYDCWLLTDDAHGLGVIVTEAPGGVPLKMGTLSKSVGAYGGYLCASTNVCRFIRNRARSFVYSTGLPPGTVAAANKALEIIANDPARARAPIINAQRFTDLVGLPTARSPIVPIVLGSPDRALGASAKLEKHGYLVPAIRPPTVPVGSSRLRVAFTAMHTESDIRGLAHALESVDLGE